MQTGKAQIRKNAILSPFYWKLVGSKKMLNVFSPQPFYILKFFNCLGLKSVQMGLGLKSALMGLGPKETFMSV